MFTFAEKFLSLRKKNNISQRKIAKDLNLSHSTICLWETGKRRPDIELLEKIADYFKISISELISNEDSSTIEYLSQEQKKLIEKIKKLNNTQCIRLNSYADRLIEESEEQNLNNNSYKNF